jgi:hypothetical protein
MMGTRMTRMKEKPFFRFAQEYTDKGRIGIALRCFGLKCIRFTWKFFWMNWEDRNADVKGFKGLRVQGFKGFSD